MTKRFLKAAGARALHTVCQTALAMIPAGMMITEVDWLTILEVALLAGLISVIKSIIIGCKEIDPSIEEMEQYETYMNEFLNADNEAEEEGDLDE